MGSSFSKPGGFVQAGQSQVLAAFGCEWLHFLGSGGSWDETPPLWGAASDHSWIDNSSKYCLRVSLAVVRLLWMILTPASRYLGITTGRSVPALTMTIWELLCRSTVNPTASKIRTSVSHLTGRSLVLDILLIWREGQLQVNMRRHRCFGLVRVVRRRCFCAPEPQFLGHREAGYRALLPYATVF